MKRLASKRKDNISSHAFRVKYLRRSRELYRRYVESKPWLVQLYSSFFDIKPGQKVVDVGCGTGDFTQYLARISNGRATILGIDSNERSIRAAIAESKKTSQPGDISYRKGDVYNLPLADGYADLTCCRTLLMHLPDSVRAVKEMARVTRNGGSVVAVEPGGMDAFCDPGDEGYTKLTLLARNAWHDGIKKLENKEFRIGERLPRIFQKAGLSDIKAEIQADAWLYTDPRRRLGDLKADLRFDYSVFKERRKSDRKYLLAGGLSNATITSYFRRLEARTKALLSDDKILRSDATFYGASFFLVSGTKRA